MPSAEPRRPRWPRKLGWSDGTASARPYDVTIAAPVSSARRHTSSPALLHCTPPPARMTGRWAEARTSAARCISPKSPLARVWPARYESGGSKSRSISAPGSRSRGISSNTGPILPEVATRKAWRRASGRRSVRFIGKAAFVMGLNSATWSNSCVELRYWSRREAEGAMTTTGEWATYADPMP